VGFSTERKERSEKIKLLFLLLEVYQLLKLFQTQMFPLHPVQVYSVLPVEKPGLAYSVMNDPFRRHHLHPRRSGRRIEFHPAHYLVHIMIPQVPLFMRRRKASIPHQPHPGRLQILSRTHYFLTLSVLDLIHDTLLE